MARSQHERTEKAPEHRAAVRWIALAALAVVIFIAASLLAVANAQPLGGPDAMRPPPVSLPSPVQEVLASMTLEQKVGQVFMTHGYGAGADDRTPEAVAANRRDHGVDTIRELVERYHLGGVVYFTWSGNLAEVTQVARLSNGIQQAATAATGVPALIGIDQEHAYVERLPPPATRFPGSMALGAVGSTRAAATAATVTARELLALGINTNFAPVTDVNVNPANPVIGVRSFSSDPAAVSALAAAQARAFQTAGVGSAAKHFPGHGDTDVDSHLGLPRINHTREQLDTIDLPPFRAAIAAGVDMVMTAHIVVPALDASGLPATLSQPVLDGLLRERLGFDGVIVTDSLRMQGAQPFGEDSPRRAPVEAFKAGADLLLMPSSIDAAYHALLDAVRGGEISEERLDASVTRILELKRKRGLLRTGGTAPQVDPDAVAAAVGTPEHTAEAARIAEAAVTLVSNDGTLPLDQEGPAGGSAGRDTRGGGAGSGGVLVAGWSEDTAGTLAAELREQGVYTRALNTGTAPTEEAIGQAVAAARAARTVVVATSRLDRTPAQQQLVEALVETGVPVVAAATREPYDVGRVPGAAATLATYSAQPVSLRALAHALTGAVNPSGKLPVDVPGPDGQAGYPLGHGKSY